jgi:hypothetical protein
MAKIFPRKRIGEQDAKLFAEMLDRAECDLCRIQHQMFKIRQALQAMTGETIGYQYDDDTERAKVALEL